MALETLRDTLRVSTESIRDSLRSTLHNPISRWTRPLPKRQTERFSNLRELLDHSVDQFGDKVLYKWLAKDRTTVNEMTFRQFRSQVNYLGTALSARGLRDARAAVISEERPEWMLAFMAVLCGGGLAIPMDRELDAEHVGSFLALAEAEAVFCSAAQLEKVRAAARKAKTVRYIICFDRVDGDEEYVQDLILQGRMLLSDGYVEYSRVRLSTDKPCVLLFTSGTTGTSKGVLLSQNNLTACIYYSCNMVDIHESDVLFSVLPFHHTYELVCGELGALCIGATVCINNSLRYFMRNIQIFRPTAMIVVPLFVTSIYRKIREEVEKKRFHQVLNVGVRVTSAVDRVGVNLGTFLFRAVRKGLGGRLRTMICGGAALNPEMVDKFSQYGIRICQGYGITECSPLVCVVPYTAMRKGSVGLPAYGTEVKIVEADESGKEKDMPPHVIGEICVRGGQVMLGYYLNQKATKAAMTSDGYFRTGDFGYVDNDGYLYITGRKKNIIILSNGKNVYPEELEEYLYENELVKDCVVLARPQEEGDAVITAVVYPDYARLEGKSDEEIISMFRKIASDINRKLPTFKQIRNIELRKTEFEKTTTQKIQRYKV